MQVKTSELTGVALDWAVVYLECLRVTNGKPVLARDLVNKAVKNGITSPSTDWSQGGPIIEREKIRLRPDDGWSAAMYHADGRSEWFSAESPLIAAMRCYVASKLGDVVDIPDELMEV